MTSDLNASLFDPIQEKFPTVTFKKNTMSSFKAPLTEHNERIRYSVAPCSPGEIQNLPGKYTTSIFGSKESLLLSEGNACLKTEIVRLRSEKTIFFFFALTAMTADLGGRAV